MKPEQVYQPLRCDSLLETEWGPLSSNYDGALEPVVDLSSVSREAQLAGVFFEQSRALEEMGRAHCDAERHRLLGQLHALEAMEESSRAQKLASSFLPQISAGRGYQPINSYGFKVRPVRSALQRVGSSIIDRASCYALPSIAAPNRGYFRESNRRRASFGQEDSRQGSTQRYGDESVSDRVASRSNRRGGLGSNGESTNKEPHARQRAFLGKHQDSFRWNRMSVAEKARELEKKVQ